MENNIPLSGKRIWNIVRMMFLGKKKLMMDLNMMLKRSKIAGKAIGNLMFHHGMPTSGSRHPPPSLNPGPLEYEFSCSNTPYHPNRLHLPSWKPRKSGNGLNNHLHNFLFGCAHLPETHEDDPGQFTFDCQAALEILERTNIIVDGPVMDIMPSPMLPGFGRTPLVRQLRITDSPFPLKNDDEDDYVDKAAEEFIQKFYKQLRQQ